MICPICKEKGLKSQVMTSGIMSTLMGYTSYYDEENPIITTITQEQLLVLVVMVIDLAIDMRTVAGVVG